MVKLLFESLSHPSGADSSGAMPIGGPCAKVVAAKESAASMLVVRMVKSRGSNAGMLMVLPMANTLMIKK